MKKIERFHGDFAQWRVRADSPDFIGWWRDRLQALGHSVVITSDGVAVMGFVPS